MRPVIALLVVALVAAAIVVFYQNEPEPDKGSVVQEPESPVAMTPDPPPAAPIVAQTMPAPEDPLPAPEDSDGAPVREIEIEPGANFMETMSRLGLDNIEERLAEWYKGRGYAFSDQTGTYLLEQPYQEYDDATLRAFADNGDIWAQQFLAERLAKTRPAEALELYQKAAASGSVNAMQQIVKLYSRIDVMRADGPNLDDTHRQQLFAIKDSGNSAKEMSYAWAVAAELAGGDPFLSNQRAGALSDRLDDDGRQRACEMAESLYDQMVNARTERNLGDFDRQPPPFMLGTIESLSGSSCDNLAGRSGLDYSRCENVRAVIAGEPNQLVICNPDQE
ncbi:MAG: hypothetical protein HKN70_05585 [Gammaproteobacteria bacterium]|nr:hypothetical protein [Gammaproteobacteria bacterium]